MNIELKKEEKSDFTKIFFKLVSNAVSQENCREYQKQ